MTTYRANIWSAMSGDFDKLSVKTKKARRDRCLKQMKYWRMAK